MALSDAQREHFKRRLLDERARAQESLDRLAGDRTGEDGQDRAGDVTSMPTHMADLGSDTMDAELSASNETRISNELAEIDAALERLYSTPEQFGVAEDTGTPIPLERLEIIPWARNGQQAGA
ncbi:MAG: hypothetical protein ABI664_19545 [bacterium]